MNPDAGKSYAGIGCCIYCGHTPYLSKEHIFPYSLQGNITILDASCIECGKVTHAFEGACASKMFGPLRDSLQFPSRNRKGRPQAGAFEVFTDGSYRTVEIPFKAGPPVAMLMPVFEIPGLLEGRPPSEDVTFQVTGFLLGPDKAAIEEYLKQGDNPTTRMKLSGAVLLGPFMRMLAKIAHCLAIAELGPAAFSHLLPDYILGRNVHVSDVVGSCYPIDEEWEEDQLHAWSLSATEWNGQWYVTAVIQLFRDLQFPTYTVVVGDASPDL